MIVILFSEATLLTPPVYNFARPLLAGCRRLLCDRRYRLGLWLGPGLRFLFGGWSRFRLGGGGLGCRCGLRPGGWSRLRALLRLLHPLLRLLDILLGCLNDQEAQDIFIEAKLRL